MTKMTYILLACLLPVTALAQTRIAPPTTGLMLSYSFWPEQYVQWLGPEVPYSMLELDVNGGGKTPVYNVTLTDKSGEKRTQYTNDDGVVAAAKALGAEVHKTAIAFEAAETVHNGGVSTMRMTLADGKALRWHFVQGSDVSGQGSGLTPLPQVPVPVFAYREQGAVAGEGTAVQIGDVVSTASVWEEISQPPYFIGYHGAYTRNAHRLTLGAGRESWKVTTYPKSLGVGEAWEMDGAMGAHETLRIEKVEGAHFVISITDGLQTTNRTMLEATRTGDGWTVERVRFVYGQDGEKHPFTVQFGAAGTIEVLAGKKTVVASAGVTMTGGAADRTLRVEMKSPAWAKGKTMAEEATSTGDEITVAARPGR